MTDCVPPACLPHEPWAADPSKRNSPPSRRAIAPRWLGGRILPLFFTTCLLANLPSASARAEESPRLCHIIARLFVQPPSRFIAERGEPAGEGRWISNVQHHVASCVIRQYRYGNVGIVEHSLSCVYPAGDRLAEQSEFYERAVSEIRECLGRTENGAEFVEVTRVGGNGRSTLWSRRNGADRYFITMTLNHQRDGNAYFNALSIVYEQGR